MHVWISSVHDQDCATLIDAALAPLVVNAPKFGASLGEMIAEPNGVALTRLLDGAEKARADGEGLAAAVLEGALQALTSMGCLCLGSGPADEAVLTMWSVTNLDTKALVNALKAGAPAETRFRLSRFATIRRDADALIAERPLSGYRAAIRTETATGSNLLSLFTGGASVADLSRGRIPGAQRETICAMLILAGIIGPLDDQDRLPEDLDETLRQWEPQDLAFHARSRMGYTTDPIGATFRFKDDLYATPALHPEPPNLGRVSLFVPDLGSLAVTDITLTRAVEARTSRRPRLRRALTLVELGVFLYRTARIRTHYETELGSFTSRPYPSGGGSYESELYITVQNVAGLRPGFYYYAAQTHELLLLREWDAECASLAQDALTAMAMTSAPDVVLTFGARFQRMQWKYSGMAYATQLKTTGAAYMAFYLAATAMGLSPCGLGLGNAATFARLTGQDPHKEGSIGEFALSGPGDA